MRAAFVKILVELAERDPRILLLTGDLGYTVLEPFIDRFSERYFNVGVAESNMIGLATGLAEAGFLPFVYSIATFATLRPYEFIRNGPILHRLPVRIVGVGSGFDYGYAGSTHHALEDVGVMRAQPGITVVAPADFQQASSAFLKTWDLPGPVYYRLGKDDKLTISGLEGRFELGRVQIVRDGEDVLLVTMGSITEAAVTAAQSLAAKGINCTVAVVSNFNPSPINDLNNLLSRFSLAITVEEHYVNCGLGSLVCEVAAEGGLGCQVIRCGVKVPSDGISGNPNFLRGKHGLNSVALADTVLDALRNSRRLKKGIKYGKITS